MKKNFNFLKNEPLGEDLFEGKGQERIADVLVDIINDERFKVIGIDGSWGTGKSNLVKIIQRKLEKRTSFFIYDVWGHQEDEQRKAILVELTEFIKDEKISLVSNKADWDNNLKALLANRKETTTINQPYLSVGFIFSLFSIIYIPTVNVFKDLMADFLGIERFFWKLLLVAFPLFIVLGIYVYNLFNGWTKRLGFGESFRSSAQETFQVYTNKQKEETKVETVSENQPSVRDFRNWMQKIDNDLGGKKLVLVFDNFDRLPKKQILSIWSVIHIFFSETKYKNIKIIVPFDRLHIKNAFKDLNGTEQDYANDYINKTFDIVYRVAPPILSSWKTFFKNNWKTAFPEYDEIEYIKVEQAYEVFKPNITPREIIAFINEVVSIKLLDDSIADRYISVFVLNKEKIIDNPLAAVTNLEYLKGLEYQYKDDDNFQKTITALAYQIKADNALEVVYKKELKDSLVNADSDTLDKIAQTNVFSKILGQTINEIENFENPIAALSELKDSETITAAELQSAWDDIYLKQKSKELAKGKLDEYQVKLLGKISYRYKKTWLNAVIKNLYAADPFSSEKFSADIDRLVNTCEEKDIDIDVFSMLEPGIIHVQQFKTLIDIKKSDYRKYKLGCTKESIKEFLQAIRFENIEDANFISYLTYKHELKEFHELLRTFIGGHEADPIALQKIFNFLKETSSQPIQNPLADSQVYNLMNQLSVDNDFFTDLSCMAVKYGIASYGSYQQAYDKAFKNEDKGFCEKVAERIEHYIGFEELLRSSISFKVPLIQKVIQLIVKKENINGRVNVENIVRDFLAICDTNGIDPEDLFKELDNYDYAPDYNFAFGLDLPLFSRMEGSKSETAKKTVQAITRNFRNASGEVWRNAFRAFNSKELEILKIIGFREWDSYAVEGFKERLLEVSRFVTPTTTNKTNRGDNTAYAQHNEELSQIGSLVLIIEGSGNSLLNTFKNLRDEFITSGTITSEKFNLFIPIFFRYDILDEKAPDVLRTIFKTSLLENPSCVAVMRSAAEQLRRLLEKCRENEKSDFVNAIKVRKNEEQIAQLAGDLGIKINNPDE